MKKRKFYIPDCIWDIAALESWLEHLSQKGWQYREEKGNKALFLRIEPQVCRVRLEPGAEDTARDDLYADLGWDRWGTLYDYTVYACANLAAPEPHTDPETAAWAREKMLDKAKDRVRKNWQALPVTLSPLGFILLLQWDAPVEHLVCDGYGTVVIGALVLLALMTVKQVYDLRCIRRARRETVRHEGDWRHGKRVALAILALCLFFQVIIWGEGLWNIRAEKDPLPYVSCTTLDPETGEEPHSFASRSASFLAPTQYEVLESWEGRKQVVTHYCEVRFEFLAQPLYNEWLQKARKEYAAQQETLADARFDQADLLTAEDHQILFLRKGTQVLSVNARDFFTLQDHLDDYAAMPDTVP